MAYDFSSFIQAKDETVEWLVKEFASVRAGRAMPTLLDKVQVDAYGAKMPLNQLASVTIEDPRTLRVAPFDVSVAKDIEKAISYADLGVSVTVDQAGLRVHFPELTADRRTQLVKVAKDKLEQARITLRAERDKVWSDIQAQEKGGEISEDEKFRLKDEMQMYVDQTNNAFDDLLKKKEEEISF